LGTGKETGGECFRRRAKKGQSPPMKLRKRGDYNIEKGEPWKGNNRILRDQMREERRRRGGGGGQRAGLDGEVWGGRGGRNSSSIVNPVESVGERKKQRSGSRRLDPRKKILVTRPGRPITVVVGLSCGAV